jgi:hypothetical protein
MCLCRPLKSLHSYRIIRSYFTTFELQDFYRHTLHLSVVTRNETVRPPIINDCPLLRVTSAGPGENLLRYRTLMMEMVPLYHAYVGNQSR